MVVSAMPDPEQVRQLICTHSRSVPAAHVDQNGHMNVRYYQDLYSDGFDNLVDLLGFAVATDDGRTIGLFDVRHHTTFRREVLEGHEVAVHVRMFARSDRRFHGIWFLLNLTSGEVANSMEFLTACVDLGTRRSTAMPEQFAAALDRQIAADRGLGWDLQLSGAISIH